MPTVNNNTPTLRFPEFKEEWELKKLGKIAKVSSGGTPSRAQSNYWNGNIPWVSTTLIDFNTILESNEFITNDGLANSSAKLFPKGTLLMAMYGQGKTRGKVAILGIEATTNQACGAIVPNNDKLNELFLFQNLAGRYDEIRDLSNQGGQENLSGEIIKNILITLPTLPEQQKIATFLTTVDEKLQALKQKKSLLEQYRKGVMQQIFSQEIRFKDDNGNEYSDWEEKKLGDVCEMKNGYAFKSNSYSVNGKYNIVTISNVQNGYLDIKKINKIEDVPNECLKHQILEIGDLLISLTGNVGRVCFVSELNCLLNQRVGKLIPKNISKLFLFQLLRLEAFITQMIADSQGGAQLNLSKPDIERYEIYLPSMSEQIKIATFLSTIDEKINHCQAQITNTEVWKKGLLQGMFV